MPPQWSTIPPPLTEKMSRPIFRLPPSVRPLQDASLFRWIEQRVRPGVRGEARVYFLLPDGFEAYARILRLAYQRTTDYPVRWSEIAAQVGTTLHSEADFEKLAGPSSTIGTKPRQGQLPTVEARELVRILRKFTTSPRCLFAIWEGWGGMASLLQGAVSIPDARESLWALRWRPWTPRWNYLTMGFCALPPVSGGQRTRPGLSARAFDELSTFVGGSRACIDEILASGIETFEVSPDARFDRDADTINGF